MKNNEKMETLLIAMEEILRGDNNLKDNVLDILTNHIETFESLEEVKAFMEDLRIDGCVSGMISELTCYSDTKEFFINNLEEIQYYVNTLIDEKLYSINKLDYNEIVWVVFETIANEFFYTIEDEIDNIEAIEEEEIED